MGVSACRFGALKQRTCARWSAGISAGRDASAPTAYPFRCPSTASATSLDSRDGSPTFLPPPPCSLGSLGRQPHPVPAFADSGGQVTYYTLTLCSPNDGAILADPIGPSYVDGTVVTLTADSDPGYAFDYWTGALSGSDNPETITMNAASLRRLRGRQHAAGYHADRRQPALPPMRRLLERPRATADDNHNGEITDWILVGGDTVDPETPEPTTSPTTSRTKPRTTPRK